MEEGGGRWRGCLNINCVVDIYMYVSALYMLGSHLVLVCSLSCTYIVVSLMTNERRYDCVYQLCDGSTIHIVI